MILRFIIWLYLRVLGVRFYQHSFVPRQQEFRHTKCVTYDGSCITFKFQIVTHDEYNYLKGGIKRYEKKALLIHAEYDEKLPEEIRKWNNLAFYFPGIPVWLHRERIISEMMLLIYLDFIRNQKRCSVKK